MREEENKDRGEMGRLEDGLGRVDACHRASLQELKDVIHNQSTHTRTHTRHLRSLFLHMDRWIMVSFFFSC